MKKAVIFDLDGVIVSTDKYHYNAWKRMADEEGIYFDWDINERLRGVSRMDSLNIILEKAKKEYSLSQKEKLASRKNDYYVESLKQLKPEDILPGVMKILNKLKNKGVAVAIGSSSRNTKTILKYIGLSDFFDAVADGNDIKNSKPDPEVFQVAAKKLGKKAEECVVVEDAVAGIDAVIAAKMKAVGVGSAANYYKSDVSAVSLDDIGVDEIIK
jgi:beta-phosphoglucomutase